MISVREATHDDVGAIHDIASRAWSDTYGDTLRRETIEAALAEWYEPASIRSVIDSGPERLLVAAGSDAVVGYLRGRPAVPTARIGAIYADPERRGEGIGTALLERFESVCRERGCVAIELWALGDNEIGASFYRSRGFESVETGATELFGEQVTETLFRRPLE